jgi:hypothetical protein
MTAGRAFVPYSARHRSAMEAPPLEAALASANSWGKARLWAQPLAAGATVVAELPYEFESEPSVPSKID